MFTDSIAIKLRAGKGGNGLLSFRHEKYRPRGGPDGGDGGHGGSIVLVADHNINTLSAFRSRRLIHAEDGEAGSGNQRHGKSGDDVALHVPEGTQVYENGQLLADLTTHGQTITIAKGGRGGFGNAHFTSSVRQAPRATEIGEAGEEKQLQLELKLVADVGLVGLPNAGKSTLLSVISNAKPEIGDYPFTTLTPNLGVVDIDNETILVADIPGLIEGASEGKGLGDQFLRHVERTAVILHLVDAYSETIAADYRAIVQELEAYKLNLSKKPRILALTKTEGMAPADVKAKLAELKKAAGRGAKVFAISAAAHQGITELLRALLPVVLQTRAERAAVEVEDAVPVIDESTQPDLWQVTRAGGVYEISGQKLEGFARRTNWDNDASVDRLRDILHKQGINKELARQGAEPGALVKIAGHELEWLG